MQANWVINDVDKISHGSIIYINSSVDPLFACIFFTQAYRGMEKAAD